MSSVEKKVDLAVYYLLTIPFATAYLARTEVMRNGYKRINYPKITMKALIWPITVPVDYAIRKKLYEDAEEKQQKEYWDRWRNQDAENHKEALDEMLEKQKRQTEFDIKSHKLDQEKKEVLAQK